MSRRPIVRRFILAVVAMLLAAVSWATLWGGFHQIPRARTFGQQVETAVQLVCGLLGVLSVLTCIWGRGRRWNRPVLIAWTVSLPAAAGLSGLVWGPPMLIVGLGFAAGTLLLALGVIWLVRASGAAQPAPAAGERVGHAG